MKNVIAAVTVGLIGVSAPVHADGAERSTDPAKAGDCVPKKKRPPKKPKSPPKKPSTKPDCGCVGKEGPPGPPGPKGDDGLTRVVHQWIINHETIKPSAGVRLGLGVIGAAFAPTGDWAWGPAIELELPLTKRTNLALEAGLAMGVTDGRESGWLGRAGIEQARQRGFTFGLNAVSIDGSDSNGQIDGYHLAVDFGMVDRIDLGSFDLKVRAGVSFGYSDDDHDGLGLNVGLVGSAYTTWGL